MTLNGVMAVILRYFSEFGKLPGALRKSSRSLSHLLMSSCFNTEPRLYISNNECDRWWRVRKPMLWSVVDGGLCLESLRRGRTEAHSDVTRHVTRPYADTPSN